MPGFDVPNTLALGAVLAAFLMLFYSRVMRKAGIKADRNFALSLVAFSVFGSGLRVLEDAHVLSGFFFTTPGIIITVTSLLLASVLLSVSLRKFSGIPWHKTLVACGVVLCVPVYAALIPLFQEFSFLFDVATLTLAWVAAFLVLGRKLEFFNTKNALVLSAQMLDASSSFVAMNAGFVEQHVVPGFFASAAGPASIFALKLLVIVPVLYVIDRYAGGRDTANYLKIAVAVMGLVTGLRNTLSLML